MAAPAWIAASPLALAALCLAGYELPPPATEEEVAAYEELDRLMLSPPPGMSDAERADRIVALYPKPRKLPGMGHYERVHEYAATALPAAVAIQRQYPKTDHFITHFGFAGEPTNTWNTESFFGNRYTLTMQVEIAVDHDAETFRPVGPPTFFLLEAKSATIDGGAKYRNQVTFGPTSSRRSLSLAGISRPSASKSTRNRSRSGASTRRWPGPRGTRSTC